MVQNFMIFVSLKKLNHIIISAIRNDHCNDIYVLEYYFVKLEI